MHTACARLTPHALNLPTIGLQSSSHGVISQITFAFPPCHFLYSPRTNQALGCLLNCLSCNYTNCFCSEHVKSSTFDKTITDQNKVGRKTCCNWRYCVFMEATINHVFASWLKYYIHLPLRDKKRTRHPLCFSCGITQYPTSTQIGVLHGIKQILNEVLSHDKAIQVNHPASVIQQSSLT